MPNCDFYATAADHAPLLAWLFAENTCAVYEAYSPGEAPLRRFASAAEIMSELDRASGYLFLQLHVNGSGPVPEPRRIDLKPEGQARLGARFRYFLEGWGLVQLQLYVPQMKNGQRRLDNSHTNHNSQNRAERWEDTLQDRLGSPDAWDFKKITAFSARLNRQIRKSAVVKSNGRSILAGAWAEWENGTVLEGFAGTYAGLLLDIAERAPVPKVTDLRKK